MTATDRDDDPTHALDGFVQRMRQPAGPAPLAPDLSDIGARLHPRPDPPKPRGGVLRSGQRWDANDVDDVPVLELPRAQPVDAGMPQVTLPPVQEMPAPDGTALQAATRHARDFAASQWDSDAQAATQPVWQPDPVALQLRPAVHPRLLVQWQPGAWVGALRQVLDSSTELRSSPQGPVVESFAPQRLLLLWPPRGDAGPPGRWPQQAWLLTGPAAQTGPAALALLPDEAPLWWMPETGDVDWALGAELVLHHTPGLRPFQVDGLRAFIAAEREAVFARINTGYHQPSPAGAVCRR